MRKTPQQEKILKEEYKVNPIWSKEKIKEIAARIGLQYKQVYKTYSYMRNKDGLGIPKF